MIHARLTDTLREHAALFALGALPPDEHETFDRHLDGCPACRAEVDSFAQTDALLAFAAPAVSPPSGVRARILDEARAATGDRFRFRLRDEGDWTEIQPGILRKILDTTPAATSFLIRMAPGAEVASHHHGGTEQCYVLEGDVRLAGRVCHAGDFHVAEGGTVHQPSVSDGGCLLLVVQSA